MASIEPEMAALDQCIGMLKQHSISIQEIIQHVMSFTARETDLRNQLLADAPRIIDQLIVEGRSISREIMPTIVQHVQESYRLEVERLCDVTSGFHFNANHATVEQVDSFSIPVLAGKMKDNAPGLWAFLAILLDAGKSHRRVHKLAEENAESEGVETQDVHPNDDLPPFEGQPNNEDEDKDGEDREGANLREEDEDEEAYWRMVDSIPNAILEVAGMSSEEIEAAKAAKAKAARIRRRRPRAIERQESLLVIVSLSFWFPRPVAYLREEFRRRNHDARLLVCNALTVVSAGSGTVYIDLHSLSRLTCCRAQVQHSEDQAFGAARAFGGRGLSEAR